MASRRERLRAQGLRPVQHWVPDLRNPEVREATCQTLGDATCTFELNWS